VIYVISSTARSKKFGATNAMQNTRLMAAKAAAKE
jgi:hypothetical protein